jgi:hypothetical protein
LAQDPAELAGGRHRPGVEDLAHNPVATADGELSQADSLTGGHHNKPDRVLVRLKTGYLDPACRADLGQPQGTRLGDCRVSTDAFGRPGAQFGGAPL